MTFAIVPTNGNADTMTVDYRTIPGLSTAEGVDYDATSGTVVLPGGDDAIRSTSPFR